MSVMGPLQFIVSHYQIPNMCGQSFQIHDSLLEIHGENMNKVFTKENINEAYINTFTWLISLCVVISQTFL